VHRAKTGVAPNGKTGGIPTLSTKFDSKENMMAAANVAKIDGDKFKSALSSRDTSKETLSISFDMPNSVGYGFSGVPKGSDLVPSRVDNLTIVVAQYRKNDKGVWYINTLYPANKHVGSGGG
jgi:hypothetical protein|tara:strand:+ start:1520 stop:1885 length:366 start_codon:yes stop_codon:yes gene_type:complete